MWLCSHRVNLWSSLTRDLVSAKYPDDENHEFKQGKGHIVRLAENMQKAMEMDLGSYIWSNFNGSNTFKTMKISSRQG